MTDRALKVLLQPFNKHLSRQNVTEVVVNQPGRMGIEADGQWEWVDDDKGLSYRNLRALSMSAAFNASQNISERQPLCRIALPAGERMQACLPPATSPGVISLTIRKPSTKRRKIDDDDFEALFQAGKQEHRNSVDQELARLYQEGNLREFFRRAVKKRKTICVCGPTGGGKTDMIKRFLGEIPPSERIVTIEDTAEFGPVGPANRVNLFYGDGRAKLAAEDVVEASLRMRPDRIIMQEVRGKEAFAFLRGLVSGHSGMTTWHAEEGQEWDALELMVRQHPAGREIPDANLRRYLQTYIDVMVYVRKDENVYKAGRVWARGITQ